MSENDKTHTLNEQEEATLRLFCSANNFPYPDENFAPEMLKLIEEFRDKMQNSYMQQAENIGKGIFQCLDKEARQCNTDALTKALYKQLSDMLAEQTKETGLSCNDNFISNLTDKILAEIQKLAVQSLSADKNTMPLAGLFQASERSLSFTSDTLTALSRARTRGIINPIAKDSLSIGDMIIASNVASRIGIGEAKLFRYGVSAFTKENAQNSKNIKLRIHGDTKDFARANGVKIDPQEKATTEEQEKENRRAAKALNNFVAKLAKNAEILKSNASFSWADTVKGKQKSYSGISFISAYKINQDVIMLEFSQTAAEYMIQLPLSDTPRALYAIDDRKPNAYAIAQALINHYGIENNVIRNTERMLKVETLLGYTSFPSPEKLKAKRWSWETLVKEPFEEALDELTQKGLLKDWRYSLTGMKELTDAQASTIDCYEQFASLYIYYELCGYEPHTDRVTSISEKRKALTENATKKQKTKPKDSAQNAQKV